MSIIAQYEIVLELQCMHYHALTHFSVNEYTRLCRRPFLSLIVFTLNGKIGSVRRNSMLNKKWHFYITNLNVILSFYTERVDMKLFSDIVL